MILTLRGNPVLSAFRKARLVASLSLTIQPIRGIYAEYTHFVDATAPLSDSDQSKLDALLEYGPKQARQHSAGQALLVVPRPGTISPWSSKASDIAHNVGLKTVKRVERGVAYYLDCARPLSDSELAVTAGMLHDRMVEVVMTDFEEAKQLFFSYPAVSAV